MKIIIFQSVTTLALIFSLFLNMSIAGETDNFQNDGDINSSGLLPLLVLNYCHNSLYNIIEYNDRIILDEEYNNIISNINISKIDDEEIIRILLEIMDTLTKFKLKDKEKELLENAYEIKTKKIFNEQLLTLGKSVGSAATTLSLTSIGSTTLFGTSNFYSHYKEAIESYKTELSNDLWLMDKQAEVEINELNKTFLETYWKILKKYEAKDEWRITAEQLKKYVESLKDIEKDKRYRKLVFLEPDFVLYPPYWYNRIVTAYDIGNKTTLRNDIDKYYKLRKGFFRKDEMYATVLMIELAEYGETIDQIAYKNKLIEITKNNRDSWRLNTFAGVKYAQIKMYEEAIKLFQANMDNGNDPSYHSKLIADVYILNNNLNEISKLLDRMITENIYKINDIVYFIGKLPENQILDRIKPEVSGVSFETSKNYYGKDNILLSLPNKWLSDELDIYRPVINIDGVSYPSDKLDSDINANTSVFTFKNAINSDSILKNGDIVPISLILKHPTGIININGDLLQDMNEISKNVAEIRLDSAIKSFESITKSDIYGKYFGEKSQDVDTSNREASGSNDKKNVVAIKYSMKNLQLNEYCYFINDNNELVKCAE